MEASENKTNTTAEKSAKDALLAELENSIGTPDEPKLPLEGFSDVTYKAGEPRGEYE